MLKAITDYLYIIIGIAALLWFSNILCILFTGKYVFEILANSSVDFHWIFAPIFLLRILLVFIDRRLGNKENKYI